jgi:hypothetical protein
LLFGFFFDVLMFGVVLEDLLVGKLGVDFDAWFLAVLLFL